MKRLGSLLMLLGVLIGGILAIGMAAGVTVGGMPFLVAVGLGKLTFLAALASMGVGATLRRFALREEQRKLATRSDSNA